MNDYRNKLFKILNHIQGLYQNGFISSEQRKELTLIAREGLDSDDSCIKLEKRVRQLSRRIDDELCLTICQGILQTLNSQ